jgi:two-component system response regulator YesN
MKENMMLTVLIVDDEQFVRVSLRSLYDWTHNGFEVIDTASDGREAMEKILSLRPDIVITDLVMPNMDGLTLLEEIKSRDLPCVTLVLSNLGDLQSIKAAFKLGAEDYFLKVDFEGNEFHRVMTQLKEAVYRRRKPAAAGPEAGGEASQALNKAHALAAMLTTGSREQLDMFSLLHLFCLRVRPDGAQNAPALQRVYPQLRGVIKEVFKAWRSVDIAYGHLPEVLFVTVEEPIRPEAVSDILKKLDGQAQVYLQVTLDILHFSNMSGGLAELYDRLSFLPSFLPSLEEPQRLWDEDARPVETGAVERVMEYVNGHIGEHLSLTKLAAHVGLNPSYLSRLFHQRRGTPLIQYVTEQKMRRAAALLSSGSYKIKEVATLLGIEDQYYFAKLFNKIYHMSPTEYQKAENRGWKTE